MNDILQLTALTRHFEQGGARIDVLRGIDARLRPGEIVALLGPSGSGKSTLLQAVGLLEGGFGGKIMIDGEDATRFDQGERTKTRREKIGFVYQFHHLLPDFNAIENVVLPQLIRGAKQAEAEARAEELLTRLGLGERLHHKPSKLSGGEQQRVAVARALANRPLLVLADEPTGNLDEATGNGIVELLFKSRETHETTLVLVTHDPALAARCDRVVPIRSGRIETPQLAEARG